MSKTYEVPDLRIEMVHLQMTRHCNLNCWFCGQRKKEWDSLEKDELKPEEWMKIVEWLEEYSIKSGVRPVVMIWGGEAMLSPAFEKVVRRLHKSGFSLGMVTNGTLLGRNPGLIKEVFEKLYISIDGRESEHDEIRGKGTYRKVLENLQLIKPNGPQVTLMMVVTEKTVLHLKEILNEYTKFEPDQVLLQDMIYFDKEEIREYKDWMKTSFDHEASEIEAWIGKDDDKIRYKRISDLCQEQIRNIKLPYELHYLPHISEQDNRYCLSPYRHIHITWNGQINFCTDFTDFSCGSVRDFTIDELFENKNAEKFRNAVKEGKCLTCKHCSWRYKDNFLVL